MGKKVLKALCPVSYLQVYMVTEFNQLSFLNVVDVLKKTAVDKLPNDLEGMEDSMKKLLTLIDDVYKYVDDVVVSYLFALLFLSYIEACIVLKLFL